MYVTAPVIVWCDNLSHTCASYKLPVGIKLTLSLVPQLLSGCVSA